MPVSITLWQNLTNQCTVRAESPCCWAQIQEETVMVVNQNPNSVTQGHVRLSLFSPFYRSSQTGLRQNVNVCAKCLCLWLNTLLNQHWILPTIFIIPPSFLSPNFSCSAVLPYLFFTGATSICHHRCVFMCLVCISLITVALHQCKFLPSFSSFVFVVVPSRGFC